MFVPGESEPAVTSLAAGASLGASAWLEPSSPATTSPAVVTSSPVATSATKVSMATLLSSVEPSPLLPTEESGGDVESAPESSPEIPASEVASESPSRPLAHASAIVAVRVAQSGACFIRRGPLRRTCRACGPCSAPAARRAIAAQPERFLRQGVNVGCSPFSRRTPGRRTRAMHRLAAAAVRG